MREDEKGLRAHPGGDRHTAAALPGVADESAHFLRYCLNRILTQIALTAMFFALMGYWLTRHGLKPLQRLAAQAGTITVANLDARRCWHPISRNCCGCRK
jgi:hypothetical protein